MQLSMTYGFVVIVWSTTPIAIKWSNSSLSFMAAASLRMFCALAICLAVLALLRRPLVRSKKDWWVFTAAGLGLFPTMLIVYWSAQFISSGLIAVLFGLYPFSVGVFSLLILKQNIFNFQRSLALVAAIIGLIIINADQLIDGGVGIWGVLGVMIAVMLFGLNSVWLKSVGGQVDAFRQITGALLVTTPLFVVSWIAVDDVMPHDVKLPSILAVAYLVVAGSVLGHTAFFYVVSKCDVASIGLITLITPVSALMIGVLVAGETFSLYTLMGSGCILLSLAVYQGLLNPATFRRVRKRV